MGPSNRTDVAERKTPLAVPRQSSDARVRAAGSAPRTHRWAAHGPRQGGERRWLAARLGLADDANILEVGCGPGVVLGVLAEAAPRGRVVGVDPSPVMLRQARRCNAEAIRAGRLELLGGEAETIPAGDASFDVVVALNSVQLWRDRLAGFRECRRVLRRAGVLCIGFTPEAGRPPERWEEGLRDAQASATSIACTERAWRGRWRASSDGSGMARKHWSGVGLKSAVALLAVIAAALGTFAVPVPSWRTGEVETASLRVGQSDAEVPSRLWIDTDAACGHGRRADPDDCLAVLGIARSDGIEIAGVSTVFGNAELAVTDRTMRELAHRLAETGIALPEIARGLTPDLFA